MFLLVAITGSGDALNLFVLKYLIDETFSRGNIPNIVFLSLVILFINIVKSMLSIFSEVSLQYLGFKLHKRYEK